MWMTREEIAAAMGIVPNSVRGKVQKGQIERKLEGGKNYYRMADSGASERNEARPALPEPPPTTTRPVQEVKKSRPDAPGRRSTPNRSSWINWYL